MSHPVDSGWAWMCTLGAGISLFWVNGGIRSLSILMVRFEQEYDVSSMWTSLMMGIIAFAMSFVAPVANIIGHKFTYRAVLMTGGLFCSLALFFAAFAPSFTYILCIFAVLTGIGYGCIFAPCMVVIAQYFKKHLALANGLAMSGGSLGMLLVPILFSILLETYSLFGCLLIISACTLHMVPATALMRPISFYQQSQRNPNGQEEMVAHQPKPESLDKNGGEDDTQTVKNNTSETYLMQQRESRCLSDATDMDIDASLLDTDDCTNAEHTEDTDGASKDVSGDGDCGVKESSLGAGDVDKSNCNSKQTDTIVSEQPTGTNNHSSCNGISHPQQRTNANTDIEDQQQQQSKDCCIMTKVKQRHMCVAVTGICDWSLFQHYLFLLYVVGMSFASAGWSNASLYLVSHVTHTFQIIESKAILLISVWGVADLIARPLVGAFSDLKLIRFSYLFAIAMIVGGIATFLLAYIESYIAIIVLILVIGLSVGVYSALFAPLLAVFIEPSRLHNAFGMCILVQGLFNMMVPLIFGIIVDRTKDYRVTYILCSILMVMSGVLFSLEPIVSRLQAARTKQVSLKNTPHQNA